MAWARYHPDGYECSSRGDRRFSALFATLKDGRTIEEAYQLDVKGYRSQTNNWREAKGKPPLLQLSKAEQWTKYLNLWRVWSIENEELFDELCKIAETKTLTDMFATSDINQARALSVLAAERSTLEQLPFTF